jgi:hypothetical protein
MPRLPPSHLLAAMQLAEEDEEGDGYADEAEDDEEGEEGLLEGGEEGGGGEEDDEDRAFVVSCRQLEDSTLAFSLRFKEPDGALRLLPLLNAAAAAAGWWCSHARLLDLLLDAHGSAPCCWVCMVLPVPGAPPS